MILSDIMIIFDDLFEEKRSLESVEINRNYFFVKTFYKKYLQLNK
jgi:hypothetical protein